VVLGSFGYSHQNLGDSILKKYLYFFLGFWAFLLVLGLAYQYFWKAGKPAGGESDQWQAYSYDNYRFSLESPLAFLKNKKTSVDVEKESKKLSIYADSPDQAFHVVVESQEYRGAIPPDHLEQFKRKVLGMLQSNATVQNLQYDSAAVTCSGQPGIEVLGNYTSQGGSYRFDVVEVSQGAWSWDMETVFLDNSSLAAEAKRIIQSLKIQN
jgi:hypothetical protein